MPTCATRTRRRSKQAQDIVERNVNILVSIAKEIGGQLGPLPAPTQGPVRKVGP
jgi:hypothetical protein